jgi:hypothetical protein
MLAQLYRSVRNFWFVIVGIDVLLMIVNSPLVRQMVMNVDYSNPSTYVAYFFFSRLDLTTESNLAVWYSSSLLLMTGLTAVINSRITPVDAGKARRWIYAAGWLLVAALMFMLSGDEVAQVHESLVTLRDHLNRGGPPTREIGAWIPLLAPFIATCAVGLLVFMGTLFWRRRPAMVLGTAGLLLWVSAVALEAVEAGLVRVRLTPDMQGFLEESCEIVGTTLLLGAFLWFLYASLKEKTKDPQHAEERVPEEIST